MLLGEDPCLVVEPATLMWREWPTCRVDVWVFRRERQLALQALVAGDQLVAGWRDRGDLKKAVEYGRIRVRLEPFEELGYRTLMELQADAGDRAGALSTYHKCAEILEHEL